MRIVITNDDSHQSPLLEMLVKIAREYGELLLVLPKHEQSWRGKCISRFESISVEETKLHGERAIIVDGTPATCANLGIYALSPNKPDLLLSGINAGLNTGVPFVFSSGTVGACFEANVCGVPAIALSQAFDRETMNYYIAEYALPENVIEQLEEITPPRLQRVFADIITSGKINKECITWNVNLPFAGGADAPIVDSRLGNTPYGSLYELRDDGRYHFALKVGKTELPADTDTAALRRGEISVTELRVVGIDSLIK